MPSKIWRPLVLAFVVSVVAVNTASAKKIPEVKYEKNKEVTLRGIVVDHLGLVNEQKMSVILLRFRSESSKKKYIVEIGPTWYLSKHEFKVDNGDYLEIVGCPTEKQRQGKVKDKNKVVTVVPRSIKNIDKGNVHVVLRDQDGKPLWNKKSN